MVEFYSDGTINNSTWRFQMFRKRCTNLNSTADRTSRQIQRNNKCPRRSLEGSPAKERIEDHFSIRRFKCEWKRRERSISYFSQSHQYSNHACKETSSAAKGLQIKAKLKAQLNAINSMVLMQRWVMGKDRNTTRGTAEKKVQLVHLAL